MDETNDRFIDPGPQNAPGGSGAAGAAHLTDDEQRRRAQEARAAKVAAGAHLRRDFLDAPRWVELARARGVLLPQWYVQATPGQMGKWLRKLGVNVEDYKAYAGERTLAEFAERNPTFGLRPWVGFVLEALESGQLHSSTS